MDDKRVERKMLNVLAGDDKRSNKLRFTPLQSVAQGVLKIVIDRQL